MKSSSNSFEWNAITESELLNQVAIRNGETKLGQQIKTLASIKGSKAKFVVLGINEDIGPQTNGGFPGSKKAYEAFLKYFVNVQSNEFLNGESILLLGNIQSLIDFNDREQGFDVIAELDEFVQQILKPYVSENYIPIIIGGGHNNAYPIIKTISQFVGKPIQVINLDPHADFRALEGRHSGNPFSYAHAEKWMHQYIVMGLHQSYNSQYLLDQLKLNQFTYTFWDEYVSGKSNFDLDLKKIASEIQKDFFGLELDMDSIAYMPASAFTPSGISVEMARKYILTMGKSTNVKYLHLPEAAPKTDIEFVQVGKSLAYLVTDFIKARQSIKLID